MPELPEVQTIVSDLQILTGDQFTGFWSAWPKAIKDEDGKSLTVACFSHAITDKKILSIERIGKNILINISNGYSLLIHLRMTGRLLTSPFSSVEDNQKKYTKHAHHIFFLKKNKALVFHDVRKFATIKLIQTRKLAELNAKLGIDPFAENFSSMTFQKLFSVKKSKSIKEFLMDQTIILGIGNIYASEILFDAKIIPTRKASSISKQEQETIFKSIKKILTKAIRLRGTSVSDYRDSQGLKGSFQNELKVYKKHGQKCESCDTMITKVILGQRSTFYCPKCQK